MSELDVIKPEMKKSYVWLQTADDSIEQVEQDVALFCPLMCHEIHAGMGSSKTRPISFPAPVNSMILNMILDYCRFHHLPGHSNMERKSFDEKFVRLDTERLSALINVVDSLQMTPLVDLVTGALVKVIEGKTQEVLRRTFELPDDLAQEEKWKPIKNATDDPHIRLLNKLHARKRTELKEREKLKNVEVEAQHVDDRSIDELLSFIHGENEDPKEAKTSKNKKKNRKRKDKQKNIPSVCTLSDSSALPSNATKESACHDMDKGNCQPSINQGLKLLDTESHRPALEGEHDDGDIGNEIDPESKERIDSVCLALCLVLGRPWGFGASHALSNIANHIEKLKAEKITQ